MFANEINVLIIDNDVGALQKKVDQVILGFKGMIL
jgi:translation initiation factor 2B subunit (eIF-2B alpha/beta/delta family)